MFAKKVVDYLTFQLFFDAVDNMHAPDAVVLSTDLQQQNQAMQQEGESNDRQNEQLTSEFAEPEKMLSAPDSEFNQANDLGQLTAEKVITESDGSNKIGSLTSRKRQLEDSLPALESETTEKLSSRACGKRTADFVPDDDDLLASILGTNNRFTMFLLTEF
jgi:cohesin complex subunit SCC1